MSGERGVLTVSELTERVKGLLEGAFPDVWVAGEIGGLSRARSGHVYLTLKDEGATLSSVIWRSTASRLRHELAEGLEVVVRGKLNLYPPRGQYQLDIRVLEPRGAGAQMAALEALRTRLAGEGLFDEEHKKPLPFLPLRIGIATSPTGAAVRDVLKVLSRRFPGVGVVLAPTRVQGEGAAAEVARALRRLDARDDLDVLIVGRGGGSLEDLWVFNEEEVVRAVAECRTPVISAVGHEVDVTLSDLAADVRAPTPSAAAELAVPEEAELQAALSGTARRLAAALRAAVSGRRQRLLDLGRSYGLRRLPDAIRTGEQRLDDLSRRAGRAVGEALVRGRERVQALAGRAEGLSPLRVLGRGYSVTSAAGSPTPLLKADEVKPGSVILTRLHRGRLRSEVLEVDDDGVV